MHRVLVNVMRSEWSVHFIAPDGKTRIGPWLLHDTHDEVLKVLEWCDITPEELEDHHSAIRRWGSNSAVVWLTDAKLTALIKRGEGWPWNGYELRQMKEAGKYPPERLMMVNVRRAMVNSNR
jgi:hypothetical protein